MERYYTIPMEIGLYPTPGIDNIRSTSFYGLTFVRVTFRYGVDYFFAYTQAALSLQQNVTLPGNQIPQIQQSSLVGEVYRYQVVGPPHFGLTNLRTVQDWIATRGLFTVTDGVVAVNSWGGTTKQYNVDVDLHKLDAYNVTIPQIISALGNANINVGGREITVGQQSVNIRGIGLFDSGGNEDLTQGLSRQRHRERRPRPVQWRSHSDQGRRQGFGRLRAEARHRRLGPRQRRCLVDRRHGPNLSHQRRRAAHQGGNREAEHRRRAAAGGEARSLLRPHRAGEHHHPYGAAQPDLRLRPGVPDPVDFPRQFAQRHHRRRQHSVRACFSPSSSWC